MDEDKKEDYKNDLKYFWFTKGRLGFTSEKEALEAFPRVKRAYEQYESAKRLLDLEINDL